uniref:Uncharacterized protein n=1 Tax=Knipowitschia caucasica TaxID=637954 RepID=A0AAV2M6I1_KNICA
MISAMTTKVPSVSRQRDPLPLAPPNRWLQNQDPEMMAIDELCRIVGGTNTKYLLETKERWSDFSKKVQFFGIWKKAMTPPLPLDVHGADFMIGVLSALPSLFPSPAVPPKKMANASESLIHILKSEEDPALYLTKRPLFTPLLLFDGTTCIIAVGNEPICTLSKEDISEAMLMFSPTHERSGAAALKRLTGRLSVHTRTHIARCSG